MEVLLSVIVVVLVVGAYFLGKRVPAVNTFEVDVASEVKKVVSAFEAELSKLSASHKTVSVVSPTVAPAKVVVPVVASPAPTPVVPTPAPAPVVVPPTTPV